MAVLLAAIAVLSFVLEVHLLVRGRHLAAFDRFPFFYSYIAFVLAWTLLGWAIYYAYPAHYAGAFWLGFLGMLLAEFAVLVEASDHIFQPFPFIRRLGRFLTASVCLIFFLAFILPALLEHRSIFIALLELTRTAALTKAVLILALLGAARLYQLPIGKNISGMLLGFAAYLAVTIANVVLAETFVSLYRGVFAAVGPLSFVLALCIWNVALWQYEPVGPSLRGAPEPSGEGLATHHAELMRLFRR